MYAKKHTNSSFTSVNFISAVFFSHRGMQYIGGNTGFKQRLRGVKMKPSLTLYTGSLACMKFMLIANNKSRCLVKNHIWLYNSLTGTAKYMDKVSLMSNCMRQ